MIGYSHIREFQQQSDRHVWDTKKNRPWYFSSSTISPLLCALSLYVSNFLIIDTEVSFLSG